MSDDAAIVGGVAERRPGENETVDERDLEGRREPAGPPLAKRAKCTPVELWR